MVKSKPEVRLNVEATAKLLKCDVKQLKLLRNNNTGPICHKKNGIIYYLESDIYSYMLRIQNAPTKVEETSIIPDKMFTVKEAAEYLGFQPQTISNKRSLGVGPKYVKYSERAIRYRQSDLDEYIQAHTIIPVQEKC